MARKVVNRKELRAENDAAEAIQAAGGGAAQDATPKGKKAAKAKGEKKAPAKRKSRAKSQEPERLMLFWGVYNQAMKRIAKFDFTQKKAADAKAAELSASGKSPHFVAKCKEPVTGTAE